MICLHAQHINRHIAYNYCEYTCCQMYFAVSPCSMMLSCIIEAMNIISFWKHLIVNFGYLFHMNYWLGHNFN